jgi:hypothetical protein
VIGKRGGLHLVENGSPKHDGRGEEVIDESCPDERSVIPEAWSGDCILDGFLKIWD